MRNISSSSSTTTTAQSVPDMVAAIRFNPTEDEKVDFLRKKMKSHNSQACRFLPVIDVRKFEPWELPEHMFPDSPHHAKAWYSFSWCDYKSINNRRFKRETKKGFWKMNSKQRDVGSKYFTCKKRTLTFQKKTFQEGGESKSVPTGWKMHEYICIKPKRGSSPHQARDQLRDLVLCVLKYKPVDSKSNKKKPNGAPIRGDFADSTGNRGYIASSSGDDEAATAAATNHMSPDTEEVLAYKQLEHDLLGSGNQDDGEPGGGSSSDFNQSLRDMIQEVWWQLCAPAGEYLNSYFPLPGPPQPHQPPQLVNALDVCSGELVDPGTSRCITYNTDNQAATMNHMISDTEEILAYRQLERDVFAGGNQGGGEPGSGILTFGDGNDETGGRKFSDFDDRAASDRFQELFPEMGEIMNSSSQPLPPSQPHQPPQPHQPQDYSGSTLQPPLHTMHGNVPYVYGDCTKQQSLFLDDISYPEYKNNISNNDPNEQVNKLANGGPIQATDERISEASFSSEEYMGPLFDPSSLQDYLLLSPMNTELGDVVHEFAETEVGSKPTIDFVLCHLKNRSPSYKKPKGDPICGKLADSVANSEDDHAGVSDMIPEPVEHLGYKELGDVNSSKSPDGSCLIDWNNILSFDDVDGETGDGKFPDLDDPAASARFLELCAEMGEILNSPPQPPHQTPQDYISSTFLSSGCRELGDVLQANGTSDDCNTIQSPFGDKNYSYTDKNDISTCDEGEPNSFTVSDFENKAVDDMSQELCVQPQNDMDLLQVHVAQQSPTYTKLEDFMDANIFYDECIKWQPQIGDKYSHVNCKNNISTNEKNEAVRYNALDLENQYTDNMILEPCVQPEKYLGSVLHADIWDNGYNNWQPTCWDKDSYLTDKKNISTNDKDKQCSSIASNFDNQAMNKRKR